MELLTSDFGVTFVGWGQTAVGWGVNGRKVETEYVDRVESFPSNFSYKEEVVVLGGRMLILVTERNVCIC